MLLASGATLLVTAGLATYDFILKQRERNQVRNKEKKKTYESIKILLTGGPYIVFNIDAEGKVKESTVSTILLNISQHQFL